MHHMMEIVFKRVNYYYYYFSLQASYDGDNILYLKELVIGFFFLLFFSQKREAFIKKERKFKITTMKQMLEANIQMIIYIYFKHWVLRAECMTLY